jgi:hypothetical protein
LIRIVVSGFQRETQALTGSVRQKSRAISVSIIYEILIENGCHWKTLEAVLMQEQVGQLCPFQILMNKYNRNIKMSKPFLKRKKQEINGEIYEAF